MACGKTVMSTGTDSGMPSVMEAKTNIWLMVGL